MRYAVPLSVFAILVLCANSLQGQPPGRGGPPGMNGGGPPVEMIIQLFTQADTNSDGNVSKAELTAVLQNQSNAGQRGRGGRPPQRGEFNPGQQLGPGQQQGFGPPQAEDQGGQEGHHGPPPKPGQVLPDPVAQSLNLNARQSQMLTALQADVDKRLAAILTDDQQAQLQNAGPPHGRDHAEGDAGNQLPNRPQRPQ